MRPLRRLSALEQVAAHLEEELRRRTWTTVLPGAKQLSTLLGVSHKTVEGALRLLERKGWLVPHGARRARRINLESETRAAKPLRVAILLGEKSDEYWPHIIELRHELVEAGHAVSYASRTLDELEMSVPRVARLVHRTTADAWVVVSAGQEVLEWFSRQPIPTFALFGRWRGLPIAAAGLNKAPAIATATRLLISLGHRRIVLLVRGRHRVPQLGPSSAAFVNELATHGIQPGNYHLPAWEESKAGFQACLTSLFSVTPPTALIIDEVGCVVPTQQFLARRGLQVPRDVSLVYADYDPMFAWCEPALAHMRWQHAPILRRVLRWAAHVSRSERDVRQNLTPVKFLAEDTIAPPPDFAKSVMKA